MLLMMLLLTDVRACALQTCPERNVTCECGASVKAIALSTHTFEVCPKTLIPCEYCTLKVARSTFAAHKVSGWCSCRVLAIDNRCV